MRSDVKPTDSDWALGAFVAGEGEQIDTHPLDVERQPTGNLCRVDQAQRAVLVCK